MTPTQDKPTLTFNVEIIVGKEAGKMASLNHLKSARIKCLQHFQIISRLPL